MSPAIDLTVQLFDPRGRCNRKGLLVVALLLLGLQAGAVAILWLTDVGLQGSAALTMKLGFFWLALAAASKRLHDLGRSAWWTLAAFLGVVVVVTLIVLTAAIILGLGALHPSSPHFRAVHLATLVGATVPIFAATMWLHLARGTPGPNRYGPEPTGIGFARPHDAQHGLIPA